MPLGNNIVNGGYSPCASFSKLIHGNHSDKTLHAKGILDPGVVCFKEINNLKSRNLPSSHHQATSLTSHNHSLQAHLVAKKLNIAKGTTDPGVDCLTSNFGSVGLVQCAW